MDHTKRIITMVTGVMLGQLEREIADLKVAHPADPQAVLDGVETWLAQQNRSVDAYDNAPVYANFHRIIGPDGTVIRNWWPDVKEGTLKAWMRRNAPAGSTVERRQDIAEENGQSWFRGKSAGEPADRDGYDD